jgi:hypothetical protein
MAKPKLIFNASTNITDGVALNDHIFNGNGSNGDGFFSNHAVNVITDGFSGGNKSGLTIFGTAQNYGVKNSRLIEVDFNGGHAVTWDASDFNFVL